MGIEKLLAITVAYFVKFGKADTSLWEPDCFSETERFGRADVVDTLETPVNDRDLLDNIARSAYGDNSRVAFIR